MLPHLTQTIASRLLASDLKPTLPQGLQGTPTSVGDIVNKVTHILLFFVGAIAIIMIIVGALQYVTSAGDPQRTRTAKDTILYAAIGLVIALLAFAIVSFVTGQF